MRAHMHAFRYYSAKEPTAQAHSSVSWSEVKNSPRHCRSIIARCNELPERFYPFSVGGSWGLGSSGRIRCCLWRETELNGAACAISLLRTATVPCVRCGWFCSVWFSRSSQVENVLPWFARHLSFPRKVFFSFFFFSPKNKNMLFKLTLLEGYWVESALSLRDSACSERSRLLIK